VIRAENRLHGTLANAERLGKHVPPDLGSKQIDLGDILDRNSPSVEQQTDGLEHRWPYLEA
jgi:hypothetical protein